MIFAVSLCLAVSITLPPGESPELWREALGFAELEAADPGDISVRVTGELWTLMVEDTRGRRELVVPAPTSARAREETAVLAASLVHAGPTAPTLPALLPDVLPVPPGPAVSPAPPPSAWRPGLSMAIGASGRAGLGASAWLGAGASAQRGLLRLDLGLGSTLSRAVGSGSAAWSGAHLGIGPVWGADTQAWLTVGPSLNLWSLRDADLEVLRDVTPGAEGQLGVGWGAPLRISLSLAGGVDTRPVRVFDEERLLGSLGVAWGGVQIGIGRIW